MTGAVTAPRKLESYLYKYVGVVQLGIGFCSDHITIDNSSSILIKSPILRCYQLSHTKTSH